MYRSVLGFHINIFFLMPSKGRAPESIETINIMEISISYLFMIIMTQ